MDGSGGAGGEPGAGGDPGVGDVGTGSTACWLSPESFAAASASELTDAARQLHCLVSATHAQLLAVIAAVDERRSYVEDGATSAAAWLVGLLGISSERAGRWVRVARELAAATPLAEAYAAGSLSFDQLRPALALVEAELSREEGGDAASGETPTGTEDEDAARRAEETEARRRHAREGAAARWAATAPAYAASTLAPRPACPRSPPPRRERGTPPPLRPPPPRRAGLAPRRAASRRRRCRRGHPPGGARRSPRRRGASR